MKFDYQLFVVILINILGISLVTAQVNFYEPLDIDTVEWSFDDFGKMWTFDNVPVHEFQDMYGFKPSEEWLMDVQRSALQFGSGCSGAFVSRDGLIMTNHHCGRNQLVNIQKEGEDILKDGFYAESLQDERKINSLYVDQLIFIEDLTEEIKNYVKIGRSDDEKVSLSSVIKDSLISKYSKETGLICKIVTLYHGGKYSLYGYKRYDDIRLVMAPDFQIAATGWDWDNFTYPRYELDFMFYRAYDENGEPIKSENYFEWSQNGTVAEEPIFVVGRPGSTDRLYSFAHLEYLRDYVYSLRLIGYNAIYYAYFHYYEKYPEKEYLLNSVMKWGNARKSYAGRLAGLNNKYIMKKKLSFQNELISQIESDPELKKKYGFVWSSIDSILKELKKYSSKNAVIRFSKSLKPIYYDLAESIMSIAEQKRLAEKENKEIYKDSEIAKIIDKLFPEDMDYDLQDNIFKASLIFLKSVTDTSNPFLPYISDYNNAESSVVEIKNKSRIINKDSFIEIIQRNHNEILNYEDPFLNYARYINELSEEISDSIKKLNNSLSVMNELLGEAVYIVYGNNIPPDATSTLRISDGVVRGYQYNGTLAPSKTTFYGLWDRYESFNKKNYPWGLHERWKIPPKELDLSTFIGFASTNDIVGGNSGSSVININKEIIGLVHDGNIESLSGHTIFLEENNRTVATDSQGLIESLKYVYKTERLVDELINGTID